VQVEDAAAAAAVGALDAAAAAAAAAVTAAAASCSFCGVSRASDDEIRLRVCSACKLVMYCCADHQRLHWKAGHKKVCVSSIESSATKL
jgi:hypothetical protein